ncbi:MAG: sodium-dependent transporter [Sedimentisphaerales bacterium]|nr:sodium-dependent transporter [Sedimentisphaerales bacterium]
MKETRENWGSRTGFILAAIGSAVGLGNVWRFPHEAYSNGGSAFLIPYIIAMIVIGIPMLIMEFSLGHLTQQAAPGAFKKAGRRWEFVGWWPIVLSFIIVCYYAVVLAWCLSYLIDSFQSPLPWAENPKKYFFNEYLQLAQGHQLGGLRWPIVAALAAVWSIMYLCIFKGVKIVSKIVLWTVPIPWLMLLVLTVRGLTLDGAVQGLEYYLEPDWVVLKDPKVWRAAFGQVFFSMTIAFGVMVTYASFLHRKSDINNNALIIALADLATSFIAGIAVFATMGALALKTGQQVHEVLDKSESVGLAFVAFPEALSQLPMPNIFSAIFFIALLLLGIDSAFSITEAALAGMIDKTGWKRTGVLTAMSLIGFSVGLLFTTRGGLSWLGTVDGIVNEGTWGIMFVGLIECLVLGWCFDVGKLRSHANKNSDWKLGLWWEWAIRVVVPGILATLFCWNLYDDVTSETGFLIDAQGKLIGQNILNLCMTLFVFMLAVILALWQPKKITKIVEFDS